MNLLAFALGPWELILIVLVLGGFAFWLWMIVDCATYEATPATKAIWIVAMVLLGVFAALPYFLFRRLPRPRAGSAATTPEGERFLRQRAEEFDRTERERVERARSIDPSIAPPT